MKFILVMLAVLLPVGVMLAELDSKANLIDTVSMSSGGGRILLIGGYTIVGSTAIVLGTTKLYDPATNSFLPLDQTASTTLGVYLSTATFLPTGPNAGKVLIAGGFDPMNDYHPAAATSLYDPATNSFAPSNATPPMNVGRQEATATVLTVGPNAGKILIAGGNTLFGCVSSTEIYDPGTNTFAPPGQTPSMNTPRFEANAVVLTTGPNAGKVLIIGGVNFTAAGDYTMLTSTELYDPMTNTFAQPSQTASMNNSRERPTATLISVGTNAGKILIAGGYEPRGPVDNFSRSTELYDPATNSFAPSVSMNTGRSFATATVISSGPNAGKVLIAGGASNGPSYLNTTIYTPSTELYDPLTNSFAPPGQTAVMNAGRGEAAAITIATGPDAGKILIAGGLDLGLPYYVLSSTELYDPLTNSFAPLNQTQSMNTARREPLVVQLPDTGASPIRFAGAGPLTDSRTQMTSVILGVPSGIQAGDVMIAQILIYDGAGTDVPSAPAGWAVIRHDAINGGGNQMTSWLYYKVADSIEPPSYAWNISLQYAAGVMRAWRGALASSPIDQSSGATAAGTNPVSVQAPSLTSANNNELQVYFYGAQAFAAPIITEPATITERLNEMSTQEGFTLAFGDLAAPPGGTVSPTYVAMATSNIPNGSPPVMAAQAVLLVPAVNGSTPTPSPTSTSTATSIPAETATATPSAAATASASATQSGTPQPTASAVATSFGGGTPVPTVSATATATATPTPTMTPTATPTATPIGMVSYSPASLKFPTRRVGTMSTLKFVTMTNPKKNKTAVSIAGVTLQHGQSGFQINNPKTTCIASHTVAAGKTCKVAIFFAPAISGQASDALLITGNMTNSGDAIGITGSARP